MKYVEGSLQAEIFEKFVENIMEDIEDCAKMDGPKAESTYETLIQKVKLQSDFLSVMDVLIEENFTDHEGLFRSLVDAVEG